MVSTTLESEELQQDEAQNNKALSSVAGYRTMSSLALAAFSFSSASVKTPLLVLKDLAVASASFSSSCK